MSFIDELKASEAQVAPIAEQSISELEAAIAAKAAEWQAHIDGLTSYIGTATAARDKLARALENLKSVSLSKIPTLVG